MLRSWDPRRNPALRPDEWAGAARLTRLKAAAAAAVVLSLLLGVAAYFWYPVDHTEGMTPEAVVETAGLALLRAGQYRFAVVLSGRSKDYTFPTVTLAGEYQRQPAVVQLSGDVQSEESQLHLEYYLEVQDLYVNHPTQHKWLLLKGTQLDELTAYYPENLAAPFLGGVRSVEFVSRDRLPGGEALQYRLDLDPGVMLPRLPDLHGDKVEYRFWVYTRTLEPAQFTMQVVRRQAGDDGQPVPTGDGFTYRLSWQFRGLKPLAVPADVKASAAEVSGTVPQATPGQ